MPEMVCGVNRERAPGARPPAFHAISFFINPSLQRAWVAFIQDIDFLHFHDGSPLWMRFFVKSC